MRKANRLAALALAGLMTFSLTACGGGAAETEAAAEAATEATAAEAGDSTEAEAEARCV